MQNRVSLKKQDQVEIIAGKDKGRVGKIIKVFPDIGKVTVEKVNIIKRHTKPNMVNQHGGIIEKEAPISVSNIKLICPKCTKTVRVGKRFLENGTKIRVCKKCGESIETK